MRLRFFFILLMSLGSSACMQTENSNSLDRETYSDLGGGDSFATVRTILTQSCANCHLFHTMSEDQLKAAGVLVGGSPATSKIYYRLAGATEGPGPADMPTGGALTTAQVAQVKAWVEDVTP